VAGHSHDFRKSQIGVGDHPADGCVPQVVQRPIRPENLVHALQDSARSVIGQRSRSSVKSTPDQFIRCRGSMLMELGRQVLKGFRPGSGSRRRMVLLAGRSNTEIAAWVGATRSTVIGWRNRYEFSGIAGLRDQARPGRPRRMDHRNMWPRRCCRRRRHAGHSFCRSSRPRAMAGTIPGYSSSMALSPRKSSSNSCPLRSPLGSNFSLSPASEKAQKPNRIWMTRCQLIPFRFV
jgi:hypothetical protein